MLAISVEIFDVIHLGCYVLGLIASMFVVMALDYKKFIKIKSNYHVYITAIVIACAMTYLLGEFLYSILTMFIK